MRRYSYKTHIRFLAILLFFLLATTEQLLAQQLKFELYFPAKAGVTHEYTARRILEKDTVSYENNFLTCRSKTVNGKKIFYLEEKTDTTDNSIISSNVFCAGVFYYEKGAFYQSSVFWKNELAKAKPASFQKIFPALVKTGTAYHSKNGEEKRTYRFTGFENLTLNNVVWEKCLKLEITQDWPDAHYTDYVWFKEGVGVVRWLRSTGRLEDILPPVK